MSKKLEDLTPDQVDMLREIANAESARACRANECGPCREPPTVVVQEDDRLLPFCEFHGEIVAEMNETVALPLESYTDDQLGKGVVFLWKVPDDPAERERMERLFEKFNRG